MSTPIRRAIYGKLAGDSTLVGLLGVPPDQYTKSIYYEEAPEGAKFPYVIFQKMSSVPRYAMKQKAYDNELWMVKGVDHNDDADPVDAISQRLDDLLTDGTLSISGKTQMYLRRESDTDYAELVAGERYLHAGSLFRLMFQNSP